MTVAFTRPEQAYNRAIPNWGWLFLSDEYKVTVGHYKGENMVELIDRAKAKDSKSIQSFLQWVIECQAIKYETRIKVYAYIKKVGL